VSDFVVVREVSRSLKALLDKQLNPITDPQLPNPAVTVSLQSPKELEHEGGLSLWLYRVTRNPELTNSPPSRPTINQLGRTPLPLDLCYLVTPVKQDPETDQVLLGRVMQTFYDAAVLRGADLSPPLQASGAELRLTLESLTLEQIAEVWHALHEPYQLSIAYHVQGVLIDSARPPIPASPVLTREVAYAQVLSSV
jgi:hypothetical protein